MPRIKFYGLNSEQQERSFTASDGCFCFLGKNEAHSRNRLHQVERHNIQKMTHIQYLDLDSLREKDLDTLQFLFDAFPFMRTCTDTPEDIRQNRYATFDVENYSLNEVMFALFHLRAFLVHCSKGVQNVRTMTDLMDAGIPPEQAYMFMVFTMYRSEHYGEYSKAYTTGDENLYQYYKLRPKKFLKMIRGEDTPKYGAKKLQKIWEQETEYKKNISSWGTTLTTPRTSVTTLIAALNEKVYERSQGEGEQSSFGVRSSGSLDYPQWLQTVKEHGQELMEQTWAEFGCPLTEEQ